MTTIPVIDFICTQGSEFYFHACQMKQLHSNLVIPCGIWQYLWNDKFHQKHWLASLFGHLQSDGILPILSDKPAGNFMHVALVGNIKESRNDRIMATSNSFTWPPSLPTCICMVSSPRARKCALCAWPNIGCQGQLQ